MISLQETIKVKKGLPAEDLHSLLFCRKLAKNQQKIKETTVENYPCILKNSAGKPLIDYNIYGNSVQKVVPSLESPVEIQSVGELVTEGENSGKYAITVVSESPDGRKKTTAVYLSEPLRKIGDYSDKISFSERKVTRKIYRLNLTADMKWYLQSVNAHGIANFGVYPIEKNATNPAFLQSNRFIEQSTVIAETFVSGVFLASKNTLYVRIPESSAKTVDEFKKWLEENPTYIDFVLENPEEETGEFPDIPTFSGTTIVETATETKPSNMKITYIERI